MKIFAWILIILGFTFAIRWKKQRIPFVEKAIMLAGFIILFNL